VACKKVAEDGTQLIPSSCAMSVWIEYTSGVPAPAHIIEMGTLEKRSVITTHPTSGGVVRRRQILSMKPIPGASVSVPGKLGRW
jgi:hypothetical protein